MRHRPIRPILLLATLAIAAPAAAESFPTARYAEILTRHTRAVADTAGTRVDYRALAGSEAWSQLIEALRQTRPERLDGREERLAYWINAYNVLAIDVVVRNLPLDSIRDAGGLITPVWRTRAGTLGGREVTLHEIEHEILRPMGDPRIHAAIVCASTSCPSLRRTPFTSAGIDAELDAATRSFLASPRKGLALERDTGTLRLSRIFDWFEEDFGGSGGRLRFAIEYAPEDVADWLRANRESVRVAHFDYDWGLNITAR